MDSGANNYDAEIRGAVRYKAISNPLFGTKITKVSGQVNLLNNTQLQLEVIWGEE